MVYQSKIFVGARRTVTINNVPVPEEHSMLPGVDMSYEYGQFGLMTEFVFFSNKVLHFNLTLFSGSGFTMQHKRYNRESWDIHDHDDYPADEDFFPVMDPGVQMEVNIFRWLRFSPGVSYRKTFCSDARGLGDHAVSDISYNVG